MSTKEIKSVLEKIHELAAEPIRASRGTKLIDVDQKVIEELILVWKEKGVFTLPIEFLNDIFGYKGINKLRVRQIGNIINNQFGHLLESDQEYHIGTAENSNLYKFNIRATKIKEIEE